MLETKIENKEKRLPAAKELLEEYGKNEERHIENFINEAVKMAESKFKALNGFIFENVEKIKNGEKVECILEIENDTSSKRDELKNVIVAYMLQLGLRELGYQAVAEDATEERIRISIEGVIEKEDKAEAKEEEKKEEHIKI